MKKRIALLLALVLMAALLAGCKAAPAVEPEQPAATVEPTEVVPETTVEPEQPADTEEPLAAASVQLFIAASLEGAFTEIIPMYKALQPNVEIVYNADSSGKLLTQVQEGFACDLFFSASPSQVKTLAEEGYMIEGTRVDLLCNKLALITPKGSGTAVTGFATMNLAKSIALADGSVPAGKYTRQVLINLGVLPADAVPAEATSAEVSEALGGVEISECSNVSKVKEAVKEGSCEIGSVYYSDAYSVMEFVDIIEVADPALTGDILYPVCRVNNPEATEAQTKAADDFLAFLSTPEVLAVFESYMFLVNGK